MTKLDQEQLIGIGESIGIDVRPSTLLSGELAVRIAGIITVDAERAFLLLKG